MTGRYLSKGDGQKAASRKPSSPVNRKRGERRRDREFSSGDRWNLLLPAALCTSLCPESCGSANGEKGFGKRREREKRGSGSIDEIARISTLFPFPSFNSCPSLQMLVSRAHAGKGFFPLFFLLSFSLSFLLSLFLAFLLRLIVEGVALKFFVRTVR